MQRKREQERERQRKTERYTEKQREEGWGGGGEMGAVGYGMD